MKRRDFLTRAVIASRGDRDAKWAVEGLGRR